MSLTHRTAARQRSAGGGRGQRVEAYPCGDGVGLPPEEAPGDRADVVLGLVEDDPLGADAQHQLSHHRPLLPAHPVEHHPVLGQLLGDLRALGKRILKSAVFQMTLFK